MITLFLSLLLSVLCCTVDMYGAANEYDDSISYRQALKIYVQEFGSLDTMIKVPTGEGRKKMLGKIADVKTQLIELANKSLEQDAYVGAVTEIMHLVGLLESAVYESKCSKSDDNEKSSNQSKKKPISPQIENFALSPRVVEVHTKIREKSKLAIHHDICNGDGNELEQALHIYRSFFGPEDQTFKVTPRGASEMNGIIYNQKTQLLQLMRRALNNERIKDAKEIMKLVGSLECAKSRKEVESPRVMEAWSVIMKWQHEKSPQ